MNSRKGKTYNDGELEVILSLAPTEKNIEYLASAFERSKSAIEIVYKIAYEKGSFGKDAEAQVEKIMEAKKKLKIEVGAKFKQDKKPQAKS